MVHESVEFAHVSQCLHVTKPNDPGLKVGIRKFVIRGNRKWYAESSAVSITEEGDIAILYGLRNVAEPPHGCLFVGLPGRRSLFPFVFHKQSTNETPQES